MGNPRYSKARSDRRLDNHTARHDCNKHIRPREHYTRKNGLAKPKKGFNSEQDAEVWISKYKMIGYVAYRCGVCGKIHIGKKCKI